MPEGGRDQPTIYDSLRRKAFAEGLAALFLNPYVKSPVTVGISGDWGMGKSSLMLQTEMILLQAAAQLAFPNILPFEDFPGSKQFELTPKGREIYKNVKHGVKDILPASEIAHIDDPLVYFLDNYQDKYSQVYKSLALMDRREMFRLKDKTSDSSSSLGKIPTVLTVRYNAWHYQNDLEALAGTSIPKRRPPSKDDARIIVFVDDLDRCQDTCYFTGTSHLNQFCSLSVKYVNKRYDIHHSNNKLSAKWHNQVLSAVNLVLAVCEINVILGMDKKMIARAIAHKHQHQLQDKNNLNMVDPVDLAEKYLSKIVQLPLALPDSGNEERIQFLNQQLGDELKESGDNETEERMQFLNQQLGEDFKGSGDVEIEESRFRLSGTESLSQEGPESLPDSQTSDMENPQENLPQSCPEMFSENPHDSLPQKQPQSGPENGPIISQILEYFGALRSTGPVTFLLLIFFGALRTTLRRWSYSGPDITSSKLKSVPINSQLILPCYTDEERKAMIFLSTKASDGPQVPREWKRFLTYHRLAWNILFRFKQVKQLPGWQKWKELVSIKGSTVNDEDPSFKIIVEHYVDRNVEDVEKDKWELLIKTLDEYDVPMDSIQSFQKFRLHCDIGYLPPPPANDTEPMSSTSASESL
ncbi:hypothetical protein SUGI_0363110 [Cryptomeria japonica]|nr:hypothetical protein SUGI_0363110 [Cryptomeria japonica]